MDIAEYSVGMTLQSVLKSISETAPSISSEPSFNMFEARA